MQTILKTEVTESDLIESTKGLGKVYIETYGCQMNEYDSGIVKSLMNKAEYLSTEDVENSDIIF